VYPTPASSLLSIEVAQPGSHPSTLAIYDASGRLHRQWQTTAGATYSAIIPVSDLAPGIYYMHLHSNGGQLSKTFMVVR
jgi:hypothetical protein